MVEHSVPEHGNPERESQEGARVDPGGGRGDAHSAPPTLRDEPNGRMVRLALLGITAGGLVVRLLHFVAIAATAFPEIPRVSTDSDMYAVWRWAESILAGDVLGRDTYHPSFLWMQAMAPLETWYRWWGGKEIFQQAPLYTYWVAALLGVSGHSLSVVLLAQLLVGSLQPLVMFALGRRLFDARVGLLAAALSALYGPLIFHQGTLLRDWLPALLEPIGLLLLLRAWRRHRRRDWALAGAALGVALLAKETVLLFLPLVLLWLLWRHGASLKKVIVPAVCLLGGLVLAVSPLIARNAIVGAPLLAFSNRAAEGFIVGNAADGFPIGLLLPPSMKKILWRSDGRLFGVVRETLQTYEGHWGWFLGHQGLKLRGLVDPLEVPDNLAFSYGEEISPVLRFTLGYGIIFPLGLAGFVFALPRWRITLPLILSAVSTLGGILFSIVHARYRLALVPTLILFGAAGAAGCVDLVRSGRWRHVIAYLGMVAGFSALQQCVLPVPTLRDVETVAIHTPMYYFSAQIYAAAGRFDRAAEEFERLGRRARQRPSFNKVAATASLLEGDNRARWALRLLEQGKQNEARQEVALAEGAYRSHAAVGATHYNLGLLYLKLGEPARARASLARFLELEPTGPQADQVRRLLSRPGESP
jgi:hypothetical protein